jgi:hypothetical protein
MELRGVPRKTEAVEKLKRIHAELAALMIELENYDIEWNAQRVLRESLDDTLGTVRTSWQRLERSSLSMDERPLFTLLIDERLRRATRVNAELSKDFATDRIRTDQQALSAFVRALNEIMEQVDRMFGSRKTRS